MKSFADGYERLARTILMVFAVNVAIILHTALGAIFLGFFPSIAAANATFRAWALSTDRSWTLTQTWTIFHRVWKEQLGPANAFGWPQLALGLLLIWDYYLVNWNDMGLIGIVASGILLLANILFGVFSLTSWAVRANFAEGFWWITRTSLRMVIARPFCSLMTTLVCLLTAWCWYTWPGILMTFGFAMPIFAVVMMVFTFGRLPGMDATTSVTRSRVPKTHNEARPHRTALP